MLGKREEKSPKSKGGVGLGPQTFFCEAWSWSGGKQTWLWGARLEGMPTVGRVSLKQVKG